MAQGTQGVPPDRPQRTASVDFVAAALSRRLHYAWVVLACAFVLTGITSGVRNAFGVLITPLVEDFGWSLSAVSFAAMLVYVPAIPFILAAGAIADAVGPRRVVLAGAALFLIGMLLTASITHLWHFYLWYAIVIGGVNMVFVTLLPVTATRWFERRRGMAAGVVFTATGFGTFVVAPLFGWMLPRMGWTRTFWTVGLAGGALALLAAFLLRSRPADVGAAAYGEAPAKEARGPTARPLPAVTLRQVRRTFAFWSLILIHFLGCWGHAVLLVHVVRLGLLHGVPAVLAAGLLSAIQGISVASRFWTPVLAERWSARTTLTMGFLLQGGAALLYLLAEGMAALYAVSVLFGLGLGAEMSAFPTTNRQFYGAGAPLNSIHAWELAGGLVGMGLGGWFGGVLFSMTGSYTWSVLMAAGATLAALPFIRALPGRRAPWPIVVAAPLVL